LGLVELLGKYDNNMIEHLNRITTQKLNLTYCSKDIQNELINLMASKVSEIIQQKVQVNGHLDPRLTISSRSK